MFWFFISPPGPNSYRLPICHRSMPLRFSLFCLLLPPNSPRRGESIYLEVTPTRQPPPLLPVLDFLAVLDLIPRSLLDPGFLHCFPVNVIYLVRLPPI